MSLPSTPGSPYNVNKTGLGNTKRRRTPKSRGRLAPLKVERGISMHEGLSDLEIASFEVNAMQLAEREQVVLGIDTFWGLDEESVRCSRECRYMEIEALKSMKYEMSMRHKDQIAMWENEEIKMKYDQAYTSAVTEAQARKRYIKDLHKASTTKEIMNYKWPTKMYIIPKPLESSNDPNRKILGNTSLAWDSVDYGVGGGGIGNDSAVALPQDPSLDEAIFGIVQVNTSIASIVNSEGMQKSRIVEGQFEKDSDMAASVLKGRSVGATIADRGMYPTVEPADTSHGGGLEASMGLDMTKPQSIHKRRLLEKHMKKKRDEELAYKGPLKNKADSGSNRIQVVGETRTHSDELDGHPLYKWDQKMILSAAFQLMVIKTSQTNLSSSTARSSATNIDMPQISNNNSLLSLQTFMKCMNDPEVLDLLKFTCFGSWIKLRQWQMFETVFGSAVDIDVEELPEEELVLDMEGWLSAAKAAAVEEGVLPQHVRTQDEHKEVVATQGPWIQILSEGNKGWYAELARNQTQRALREAKLHRTIATGDLVWALYGTAYKWLPATVERVNGDGSFNLSYPLSTRELQEAKLMASSRELLALPSQEPEMLNPRGGSEADERKVVSTVFDMIELESKGLGTSGNQNSPGRASQLQGYISTENLLSALNAKKFSRIVQSSSALALIFGTDHTHSMITGITTSDINDTNNTNNTNININNSNEAITNAAAEQIQKTLIDTCSEDGEIKKELFVEFCMVAADLSFFNGIVQ